MTRPANRKDGPLILVADIDGTFARGAPAVRAHVHQVLRNRPHSALIYVTRRPIENARVYREFLKLPRPDVYVAERGSSIAVARGQGDAPPAYVDRELDRRWPGTRTVRRGLEIIDDALDELPNTGPRRLAYAPADGIPTPELADKMASTLQDLDVDIVQTPEGCVDVVPQDVTSGFTVDRVLEWLEADPDWVVVAADTLRHADLFRPGRHGIVVAKADAGLKARLAQRPEVYLARQDGAAGVLEGLTHFGYVGPNAVLEQATTPGTEG